MKSAIAFVFATFAAANASVIIGQSVLHNVPVISRSSYVPPVYTSVYSSPAVVSNAVYSVPGKSVHSDEAVIAGPSGTITRQKISSKPGVVTYSAPAVVSAPVVRNVHYVPTVVETRKYVVPSQISKRREQLIASPFGLVPAGSGLEGAYVPDISEKFYDDGSYRPEHH